jgi:hypothetical protein
MEDKEYTIKDAVIYLAQKERVLSIRRLQSICELSGTDKQIIYAHHTSPHNRRRGEWLIKQSELDKLVARGNKRGNPTGFNQKARAARWQNNSTDDSLATR